MKPKFFLVLQREVIRYSGLSKMAIWRKYHKGAFPIPYRLGKRSLVWRSGELNKWLKDHNKPEVPIPSEIKHLFDRTSPLPVNLKRGNPFFRTTPEQLSLYLAPIKKQVIAWRKKGWTWVRCANVLNESGQRTFRKRMWSSSRLISVLKIGK